MELGPRPYMRVYKDTTTGDEVDVIVPRDQGQFPGGQGQIGQVVAYLPVKMGDGSKHTSPVIWDEVPPHFELLATDEPDAEVEATDDVTNDDGKVRVFDVTKHKVEDVLAMAASCDDVDEVRAMHVAESEGDARTTLLAGLEARIAELEGAE